MGVFGRVVLALTLLFAGAVLHVSLCEWRLTWTPWSSLGPAMLWITRTVETTPYPGAPPGTTFENFVGGRSLARHRDVSAAEAWSLGIAAPIVLTGAAIVALIPIRRLHRHARGRCPRCGYDLQFDAAKPCSECGWNAAWSRAV
jgi:hypothetical protein